MAFADSYHQPDAADPVLDDEVVLRLVRDRVAEAGRVTGVDESGGEARVHFVDDTIVFKTQRTHTIDDVNARLVDMVADQLLNRAFGAR